MPIPTHLPYQTALESELVQVPTPFCREGKTHLILPATLKAFIAMAKAAAQDNVFLVIISGFRSFDFQKALFEDAEKRHGIGKGSVWVAPAGHSEHHTGYAIDIADLHFPQWDDEPEFEHTPASKWLLTHAPDFGFFLSFPKNNWQNIGYEPWHWKFMGNQHAQALFEPA